MRLATLLGLCLGWATLVAACSGNDDGANQGPGSPSPEVPGFQLDLAAGRPHEVALGSMPEALEPIEGGERLRTSSTPEGEVPSTEFYNEFGPEFPLVTSTFRPGGSWLPVGIRDGGGAIVAVRLASEAPEGLDAPLLTFDSVVADSVDTARVLGPNQTFEDTVSGTGVRYYPPLPVLVRGQTGLYLHQEIPDVEPRATGVPVCSLIWLEGEVYYRLSGICSTHANGRYDLFTLTEGANSIEPYITE